MFLDITLQKNPKLIDAAIKLHREGKILPDTYVIDMDAFLYNGRIIKEEADKYGIKLYFMTKQVGRNPLLGKELMKLGYEGAVTVDYREAKILSDNGIKLGHVGHLVQIPKAALKELMEREIDYITVYSVEKAKEIDEVARELNITQKIILRVIHKDDTLYPAQYGGFYLEYLREAAEEINKLPNIKIDGVCSFPCFLYDEKERRIKETPNVKTVLKGKDILEDYLKRPLGEINMPSATAVENIKLISDFGGTHGEPGHGLTGTTPYGACNDDCKEIPAMVYVTEVSHNLGEESFAYGGGHYRRSHMENVLVVDNNNNSKKLKVEEPSLESIDYYFTLKGNSEVSSTAIMAFRTQLFVTRSNVAIVKGIKDGKPELVGIYDVFGREV